MSEYQYVAFRAIDAPVSKKNLDYMHEQSTRAEITPLRFDNEYHYGDFRGNTLEMLRRGYDLHLHYANFGIRSLFIRLPHGLSDPKACKPYLDDRAPRFVKDKSGAGGALVVQPFHEPGDLEELWDLDDLVERLVPLRAEILNGDLRPLYLMHLAVSCDGEHDPEATTEAPVPAGLADLTDAQAALAELYSLRESLLAAAASESAPPPPTTDWQDRSTQWVGGQPESVKNRWLAELLHDPHAPVRTRMLAEFHMWQSLPKWPTARPNRTIAELRAAADERQREADRKTAAAQARQRAKRLADMAADPQRFMRESEQLVAQRSTHAYAQAARLLAELREALSAGGSSDLAAKQAQKLKAKHPTLRHLTAALRREGFVPK